MFSRFKKASPPAPTNLFLLNLHIGRGTNSEMPSNFFGAYVPVFVSASDHESAAHKAVSYLVGRGYEFIDIADQNIHQLDPLSWDAYVKQAWPEFVDHFPPQIEVISRLSSEMVFCGPFAGYDTPRT
jgi:hypothetical protein